MLQCKQSDGLPLPWRLLPELNLKSRERAVTLVAVISRLYEK